VEGRIFLLQPDNSLIAMNETAYEAEHLLQKLLEDHADLLAGDQIDIEFPRRFFLVYREIGVPDAEGAGDRWSLDHLFLDQDGIPTFVEVKRASDTRARREVVAQMLDYAANATVHWPAGLMRQKHIETCAHLQIDPAQHLADAVDIDGEEDTFWELAERNLRDGRIRMLFVADVIPAPLRRIIEFLNEQMSPAQVLGVEVRRFTGQAAGQLLNTLVPRLIGQSEATKEKKTVAGWSGERLPLLEPAEFLESIDDGERGPFAGVFDLGRTLGYDLRPYATNKSRQIRFMVPGIANPPIYLYSQQGHKTTLYVSLGRHHQALRDSEVNSKLRTMLTELLPRRQRDTESKTEIGISASELGDPATVEGLRSVFRLVFETLAANIPDAGSIEQVDRDYR
jgi:hypothetical protein